MALLEVEDLRCTFHTDTGPVQAVRGVTLHVNPGEAVGIVGESGCGKSVLNLAVLGLIPQPPGQVTAATMRFGEHDLATLDPEALRRLRGRDLAMVFQDPMTSLNPFLRLSTQLCEVLTVHLGLDRKAAAARALELLEAVGIPRARERFRGYPHQLSGGQRQRVMIAMALLCEPQLLIADEPTTALDVTTQRQILELIATATRDRGTALILISHDLDVVEGVCQRVLVMYAGKVVEAAPVAELYARPLHPYTRGLLASVPRLDGPLLEELEAIPGQPPDLGQPIEGCAFRPRCPDALERCRTEDPTLDPIPPLRAVACWAAGV